MKIRSLILGVLAAACFGLPRHASAQVSTNDFNELKDVVQKLGQQVQELMKLHDQDLKTHEEDQKKIQGLEQQLGETKTAVTNATQKAEEVARVQSAYPAVTGGMAALHNFTMVGDAEVQFGKSAGQHATFALADFAPIFLFRASDNVLFEAGFDVMLQNNTDANGNRAAGSSTSVSMSFGQLDYLLNDYVTFVGGDMLLPLGTYSERSAGWLNKIPDDPLVRDVLPGSGVGVQLRGGIPVGQAGQALSYSVYCVNGPSSTQTNTLSFPDQIDLSGNVGSSPNWHGSPSGGGRIGWFYPLKAHYDLELGLSGQTGAWNDGGNLLWSAAVLDYALHISPNFEAKGEYINTWYQTTSSGTVHPRGWWIQAGYKLAGLNLDLPLINNVELVGRYDTENNAQGTKTDRYTAGYVYYFSNTLLFEGDYEYLYSRGPDALPVNSFVFQLSYGF
jgi:hypothetical protein